MFFSILWIIKTSELAIFYVLNVQDKTAKNLKLVSVQVLLLHEFPTEIAFYVREQVKDLAILAMAQGKYRALDLNLKLNFFLTNHK
jgi:hypothetical protein